MSSSLLRSILTAAAGLALFAAAASGAPILYVSNFGTNTVTAYDSLTGASLGTTVTGGAELQGANGVAYRGGSLYVTGQFSNNVNRYNAVSGALTNTFDPANTAGLNSGQGLTFGPDGNLYVVSSVNDMILRYNPATGAFLGTFATLGVPSHDGPIDIAFAANGSAYVTTFDSGRLLQLDGTTGAILNSFAVAAGQGLGPITIGPDGSVYVGALDLATFAGSVLRFNPVSHQFSTFIANGAGGLASPGGLAFDSNGNLLVGNLLFDQNFVDIGSTILRFNGNTGAFDKVLVAAGQGLDTPFFMTVAVPEPGSFALGALAVAGLVALRRRSRG